MRAESLIEAALIVAQGLEKRKSAKSEGVIDATGTGCYNRTHVFPDQERY